MADFTPHTAPPRGAHRALAVALAAVVLISVAACPPSARADGDPASDVLAAQSLFLPQDAPAAPSLLRRLAVVLAGDGHPAPLRVAVIASSADLGAVTALWHQPQAYARFLGQEVSLLYRGEILVAMPNGFGLARDGRAPPSADAAALANLPAPGHALVAGTLEAAVRLLRAHGVAVAAGAGPVGPSAATGASVLTWIVLGGGVMVIVAAWGVSLRMRPPGRLSGS